MIKTKYKTINNLDAGRIIAHERAKLHKKDGKKFSQDDFIEYLSANYEIHIGRNRYSDIENGAINKLSADELAAFCDIFDCDIDYLFGMIKCKRYKTKEISEHTHLSVDAVETLHAMQNADYLSTISDLISDSFKPVDECRSDEDSSGIFLLYKICEYLNMPSTTAKLGYYGNGNMALVDEQGKLSSHIKFSYNSDTLSENNVDRLLGQVLLNDIQRYLIDKRKAYLHACTIKELGHEESD